MRKGKLLVMLGALFLIAGLAACGIQGAPNFAKVEHTPIPTLPPATLPPVEEALQASAGEEGEAGAAAPCRTTPVDLLQAWFEAGLPGPDAEPFTLTDLDGNTCQVTFEDVQFVFSQAGIWYDGSPACTQCHFGDPEAALGQLSLDNYEHIMSKDTTTAGGNWEQSTLYDRLVVRKDMPLGRPADAPEKGLEIFVGQVVSGE